MIRDNLWEDVSPVSCTCIMELFVVYIKFLSYGIGNLFSTFWLSYMDMIEILLGLIRASREGDWMLNLTSVRAMILWCFAYDRLNMHDISHTTTPRCLSCPQPTQMRTLNSCKEGFQFSLAPTTPSEESMSIKRSKKR